MKPHPEVIELDYNDLQSKLDQIEAAMGAQIVQPFRQLLQWYAILLEMFRDKTISIKRLKRMLFGASTERTSNLFPKSSADQLANTEPAADQESGSSLDAAASASDSQNKLPSERRRRPGHGRTAASRYIGCAQVMVTHSWLHPGDTCPHCGRGTLYRQSNWSPAVRLKGQPPVGGTVYELERLRCHLCGKVETAELPQEAGPEKYDPTVASIIAMLRYGEGLPFDRIDRIQQSCGVPLAASIQWELVRDAVDCGPRAAYDHLLWLAAQGDLMHNDDTSMRVLALMDRIKKQLPLLEENPDRRGVFTTGILSMAEGRPTIALFFTGPYHAGENLRAVLANRGEELPPPIQMCDGLSRNVSEDVRVILGNCLTHGRRKFADVADAFPKEVEYVLECLAKVYTVDDQAKKQGLSAGQRLRLHQEKSRPVMDELRQWLNQQLDEKKVEPNSSLGEAIAYMLRHWEKLTLFLRTPGAPLDNNLCEQALKMAIRHRKNSLFYKTMRGARAGDLYMTLIHTCYFSAADPFDYLTQLQRNQERVKAAPADWMPWNYRQQLFGAEPAPTSNRSRAADAAGRRAHPPPPPR
jgi:transposase